MVPIERIIKSRRGFTLIELLIVIGIIVLLSSFVFASVKAARERSRDAKRIVELGQIQKALELYFETNQSYPSTTPAGFSGEDAGIAYLASLSLLPRVPVPPQGTDTAYIYRGIYHDGSGAPLLCDASAPSGTACDSFEVGITLERSDNDVLKHDPDNRIGGLYGDSSACLADLPGIEYCYDLSP